MTKRMTKARLEELRDKNTDGIPLSCIEVTELIAEFDEIIREVGETGREYVSKLDTILSGVTELAKDYKDAMRRALVAEARIHVLEHALRGFPQFDSGETITPEAVGAVAKEYVETIMTHVPIDTGITFVDDDGNEFRIIYEDGDPSVGIGSGWCVPEDADWYPAKRGEARKAALIEAAAILTKRAEPPECESLGPMDPETGVRECALEPRGTCLCAERMEALEEARDEIRALAEKAG